MPVASIEFLGRYDIVTRSGVATRRIIVPDRRTHGSTASTIVEETVMKTDSGTTEVVVREHLRAFLEQAGVDAIVKDYHNAARLYGEAKIYHGKHEIHGFFVDFLDSLPAGGLERFELRSLQIEGNIAYITWSVGDDIPLGTDTFVVDDGKIVSQTFAMHAVPTH
jgi:hypothetical protein